MATSKTMATVNHSHIPILDEDHFDIWKARMLIYLESIDVMLVDCVTDGPYIPMKANPDPTTNGTVGEIKKDKAEWDDEEKKLVALDSKARNIIAGTLSVSTYQKVIKKKSAKEMWDAIEDYLEGDALCKKTKKYEIERRYNNFVKRPNESLRETYDRYCEVVNACISLGKVMTDEEINMNFLNALGSKWMHKATSLEDSKCLSTWSLSNLYANLRVHELKLDRMEEVDVRIKSLSMSALDHEEKQPSKPTPDSTISTSSLVDMDDEEFAMFVKRFQKFRKNSKPFSNSKLFSKGKPSASFSKGFDAKKKGELVCYNCRKPGHFASECPQPRFEFMKRKPSTSKFSRRKGMVAEEEENSKELATWIETDSDEESEDDTEEVNLCLVVNDASSDSEEDVPTKPQKLKDVVVSKKANLIFNSDEYELTPSRKIGNRSFSRPIFPPKNQPILQTKSVSYF